MFKDLAIPYDSSGNAEITVTQNHSLDVLLGFIDRSVSGFPAYFRTKKDSDRENRISDFLAYYFNASLLEEKDGSVPFNFVNHPTQPGTAKETDIGVYVLTLSQAPVSVIEFEAKRLSDSSNNKEYVSGIRGGIERFKRGLHAKHLTLCGMFGYIQSTALLQCSPKINGWISDLALNNTDESINWKGVDEKLIPIEEFTAVSKWSSIHARKDLENLKILHYFIDLTS